jgi:hypothetical protein
MVMSALECVFEGVESIVRSWCGGPVIPELEERFTEEGVLYSGVRKAETRAARFISEGKG